MKEKPWMLLALASLLVVGCEDNGLSKRFTLDPQLAARVERKLAKGPKRYDKPKEAQEFYLLKRALPGTSTIPVERYGEAIQQIERMELFDSRLGRYVPRAPGTSLTRDVVSAQWESLGPGNIGGRTRAIVIDPTAPDTMYAGGVAGGVWKTVNGGSSWAPLDDLMANIAIGSLAMDPGDSSTLYAGTGEGFYNGDYVRGAGIFKTSNGGTNWTQLASTNNSDFHYVNDIVVSSVNSNVLYAATRTGVWRSSDAGQTWSRVLNPGLLGGCLDLAMRTDLATDAIIASCGTFTQAALYRNTDAAGAGTWTTVLSNPGMGRTSLAIAPSNQGYVYALASNLQSGDYLYGLYGVFRSTDFGTTWSTRVSYNDSNKLNTLLLTNPIYATFSECGLPWSDVYYNQGWYDNVISVDPLDPNRVWAGGIDLLRSDDGGQNWGIASYWWLDPSDSGYNHADHHAIVFHPDYNGTTNTTMFVGNDGGILKTTNARANVATGSDASCDAGNGNEVSWTNLNNNYGVTQFYFGLPYPSGSTYFGGTQDNGTLRGNDTSGSQQWAEILGGDGGYVAVDPNNPLVLFAENTGISIQKSTNGGNSFSSATSGISDAGLFITPFAMDPNDSSVLWTGGSYLWRTSNGATSWNQASQGIQGGGSVSAIAIAPSSSSYVLAGTSEGYIHRTNVGLTSGSATAWPSTRPVANGYVSSLTFDPVDEQIAYATYSSFGVTHVWRSTDAGATWSPLEGSGIGTLPDIPVHTIAVDPNDTSRLYLGTDLGVFVSNDTGNTWAQENTGFANVVTESLSVNSTSGTTYLYAFTHGRGAFRAPISSNCSVADAYLSLSNSTITNTQVFEACLVISAGTNFRVGSTGNVTFKAGETITLGQDFSVDTGGRFKATIGTP